MTVKYLDDLQKIDDSDKTELEKYYSDLSDDDF
jgi:hypothetical protein